MSKKSAEKTKIYYALGQSVYGRILAGAANGGVKLDRSTCEGFFTAFTATERRLARREALGRALREALLDDLEMMGKPAEG